jgi:hypothetical protein
MPILLNEIVVFAIFWTHKIHLSKLKIVTLTPDSGTRLFQALPIGFFSVTAQTGKT